MGNAEKFFFSRALRKAMVERDWSQRDLAKYLNVHPTTANAWIYDGPDENRILIPSEKHFNKIAELTGLSRGTLVAAKSIIRMINMGVEIKTDPDAVPSYEDLHPHEHALLLSYMDARQYEDAIIYIMHEWKRQSKIEEEKSKKKGGKGK